MKEIQRYIIKNVEGVSIAILSDERTAMKVAMLYDHATYRKMSKQEKTDFDRRKLQEIIGVSGLIGETPLERFEELLS